MWSDIDFDAQIIHVRHNAIFTSAQTVVSSDLKTAAARRDIPIPPTLLALLTSEKNGSESPFVLHMDNGGALSQTSFSNLWNMVRSLDFHVTPHQLRHTYITRLFESGLDIKEIQYLAGHTTIDSGHICRRCRSGTGGNHAAISQPALFSTHSSCGIYPPGSASVGRISASWGKHIRQDATRRNMDMISASLTWR